ncbi:TPA: hypothetical protein ACH3X2_004023 [Trebouxia sp. C0005]
MYFDVRRAKSLTHCLYQQTDDHTRLQKKTQTAKVKKHQTLVGQLVYTFDDLLVQHVFRGTRDRAQGRLTFTEIKVAASLPQGHKHALTADQMHRWKQFLHFWSSLGWSKLQLEIVARHLRQIRADPAHLPQKAKSLSAQKLISYVPSACNGMGPRWKRSLTSANAGRTICSFATAMQQHVCTRGSILIVASAALSKLDRVQLPRTA